MWENLENVDETLMYHQRAINIYDIRSRFDVSLMSLMTTLMNHQWYQCVLDWGRENARRSNEKSLKGISSDHADMNS